MTIVTTRAPDNILCYICQNSAARELIMLHQPHFF